MEPISGQRRAGASPGHWPDLPSIGLFMPAWEPPGTTDTPWAPHVLDALPLAGGEALVFDSTSGAHVVRLDRDVDAVPAAPRPDRAFVG